MSIRETDKSMMVKYIKDKEITNIYTVIREAAEEELVDIHDAICICASPLEQYALVKGLKEASLDTFCKLVRASKSSKYGLNIVKLLKQHILGYNTLADELMMLGCGRAPLSIAKEYIAIAKQVFK